MIFKSYTKKDLFKLVNQKDFENSKHLPITKHRAYSFINNPRASKEDILLITCENKKELISYIGIIPDLIFHKKSKYKVGILTTWWVNPKFAKSIYGTMVLMKAINSYKKKVLIADFSKSAERVYDRIYFLKEIEHKNHYKLEINYISKYYFIKKIKNLLIILILNYLRIKTLNYRSEIHQTLEKNDQIFIDQNSKNNLFKRNKKEFDWVIKYPWIKNGETELSNYNFSSISQHFEHKVLKIFDSDNNMIAILLFSLNEKIIKLNYYFKKHNIDEKTIFNFMLLKLLYENKNAMIFDGEIPIPRIYYILKKLFSLKVINRKIKIGNKLSEITVQSKKIQVGDFESIFL